MKKHKKLWIVLGTILTLFLSIFIVFTIYVNIYYAATDYAKGQLESDDTIIVTETKKYYVFEPKSYTTGIIFYPGGKVETEAYAPLLKELSNQGILCILCKMPFHLAVFDVDAADEVKNLYDVEAWYMAGHSLGGSMAASYIENNSDIFQGLILLAAYSTSDLSSSGLEVLSIYGEFDGVLNMDKYKENKVNLPDSAIEYIIPGGCHAYFGSYGEQKGDGTPVISFESQQAITVEVIKKFIFLK